MKDKILGQNQFFSMKIGFDFETFEECIEAGLEAIKVLSKPDTKIIDLGQ